MRITALRIQPVLHEIKQKNWVHLVFSYYYYYLFDNSKSSLWPESAQCAVTTWIICKCFFLFGVINKISSCWIPEVQLNPKKRYHWLISLSRWKKRNFACDVFKFVMCRFVEWSSHRRPLDGSIDLFLNTKYLTARHILLNWISFFPLPTVTLLFELWIELLWTTQTRQDFFFFNRLSFAFNILSFISHSIPSR